MMKPIRIECPSCQQSIEFEPPTRSAQPDNLLRALAAAAVLVGCAILAGQMARKPASIIVPPPTPELAATRTPVQTRWEYTNCIVKNGLNMAMDRMDAEGDTVQLHYATMRQGSGGFVFDYCLSDAAKEGWELVGAIPEIETLRPFPDEPPNMRTGRVTLIFKRPAK